MANKSVDLALQVLAMPEGPTNKELQKQARVYLSSLPAEELELLKAEALSGEEAEGTEDLQDYKYKLFKQMSFSDLEARAYCACRLNAPGIRRVVARRALLVKLMGGRVPRDFTHFDYVKQEEERGLTKLSSEEVMELLRGGKVGTKRR